MARKDGYYWVKPKEQGDGFEEWEVAKYYSGMDFFRLEEIEFKEKDLIEIDERQIIKQPALKTERNYARPFINEIIQLIPVEKKYTVIGYELIKDTIVRNHFDSTI